MLNRITPLVLTFNEAPNIARTLSKLAWARDVVIVDSCSTDGTPRIAAGAHPGVRIFERPFATHAEQWNFGLQSTGITTDWVLAIDADFLLTDALIQEISALDPPESTSGYEAPFVYCIGGEPLTGAAYPPVVVLFRRNRGHYEQDGHTQRVRVDGAVRPLAHRIRHDDRKPLSHWLASQIRYLRLEAEKLDRAKASELSALDRVRKWLVVVPTAMPVYCLFVKGGIVDGWRGLFYALQRMTAELLLSLYLLERRLARLGVTASSRDVRTARDGQADDGAARG